MSVRLAVIVSDHGAAANVGGPIDTRVRVFDLSPDAAAFIQSHMGRQWCVVSLAIEEEPDITGETK